MNIDEVKKIAHIILFYKHDLANGINGLMKTLLPAIEKSKLLTDKTCDNCVWGKTPFRRDDCINCSANSKNSNNWRGKE